MKRLFLTLTALMTMAAAPSFACDCTPDTDGTQARALIADQNYALAQVFVRGMNIRNGQSMLDNKKPIVGGLLAPNIRAHFGHGDCATTPHYKQTQTMLIHFEPDGTYAIMGQCETKALTQYLQAHPEAAAGTTPGGE